MNPFRSNLIGQVFAKLDRDGSGEVTLDDLHGNFL